MLKSRYSLTLPGMVVGKAHEPVTSPAHVNVTQQISFNAGCTIAGISEYFKRNYNSTLLMDTDRKNPTGVVHLSMDSSMRRTTKLLRRNGGAPRK